MDAVSDPLIDTVVVMSSSQIGKTELLLNIIGYYIDQDPSPILMVNPTIEMGQAFSKDRLANMIRDTECLRGKVSDAKARESGNTILHKVFEGGHITISGANSPASLASRPVRIVLCDEVDRYPASAGAEGDPVNLARKRSTTFWNRKTILTSTPTIKGLSRIEFAFENSDKRKYHAPCPHCGVFQILKFSSIIYDLDKPETASLFCESCGTAITEGQRIRMIRKGKWIAEKPCTGTAGFWVNEVSSPWVTPREMAENFVKAKPRTDTFRVFINTSLAETWEENIGEKIEEGSLMAKREDYGLTVPEGGLVLTAGVDVQDDRLECEVVAWGKDEESWSMEYSVFHGSPSENPVWESLDLFLQKQYDHISGVKLRISTACVDTGGHNTQMAYKFTKRRSGRRIFATKGYNVAGKPLVTGPSLVKLRASKIRLYLIGTDTAKDLLHGRLQMETPGPGYMHFPLRYENGYFEQLTAEKRVLRQTGGRDTHVWEKSTSGARNEALDCRVLNMAALAILNPIYKLIEEGMKKQAEAEKAREKTPMEEFERLQKEKGIKKSFIARRPGGFVKGWRR